MPAREPTTAVFQLQRGEATFELATWPRAAAVPGVYEIAGYGEWSPHVSERHELPRPRVSVVWEVEPPIEHLGLDGATRHRGGFAAGLHHRPGRTRITRRQSGVCLVFEPLGARRFFGRPMDELVDQVVPLSGAARRQSVMT
jgi:hypothetical protein